MYNYTEAKPCPKLMPYRSEKYKKFIRSKKCLICGQESVAAHIRKLYWQAGTGIKPHDYCTISLCLVHHHELDVTLGYNVFQDLYNLDIKRIIIDNMIEYFAGEKG